MWDPLHQGICTAYIVDYRYLSEENCYFFTIDTAAGEMSYYVISSF